MKKKTILSAIVIVLVLTLLSINVFAMTNEEKDLYNHQYYPQSVNNGGINQVPQEATLDFYVSPTTGNATVRVTDIVLPGKNGFDLDITRKYNSFQSNLYEPYVLAEEKINTVIYYRVICLKDFYKQDISNVVIDNGYSQTVGINPKYYNYTTDNSKYTNMSSFEYSSSSYKISDLFASYSDALNLVNELNSKDPDISATYPNSSVGYYYADYHNCVVEKVYVPVSSPIYSTGLMVDTTTERYSRLGAGWEFNFPYVEKRYGEGYYEYLHYGDKGTWEIDFSSTAGSNHLSGYALNDIILTYDNSVSHDGYYSEYCVTEKGGKKSYFGTDGRLLLQRDRFGNEIKFYHDEMYYFDTYGDLNRYPYLIGITDSVGRRISLSYGSDYVSGKVTYKDITLTITDPKNSANNVTYIYKQQKVSDAFAVGDEANDYVLKSVKKPNGEITSYDYNYSKAPVNFFERNTSFAYANLSNKKYYSGNNYITSSNISSISGKVNYYALLNYINEPNRRECRVYYTPFLKNCTPTGSMVFYKSYYSCDDVRDDENGAQYEVNEHNYKYFINNNCEYDGYPSYSITERIPGNFFITTNDIFGDADGDANKLVTNTYVHRYSWLEEEQTILLDNTTSSSVDFKTTINYTYDDATNLIANTLTKQYDSPTATEYMQLSEDYVYDGANYGDLLSVTPNGDTDRTVSYEYNSQYHYPVKKTYKQNASKTIVEEYTPTTDNKSVKSEKVYENGELKRTVEYEHDSYGNIIQKKEYTGNDTDYIRTNYSYTDTQYNGQYTGANLMSETVYDVTDNDNVSENVSQRYGYDWRGNVTSVTDGNGNVTSYEYDSLNHVIKETAPDGWTQTMEHTCKYHVQEVIKTDALGTVYIDEYDGSGNRTYEYIGTGYTTLKRYHYDGYNNLIKEITYSNSNNSNTIKYTYDTLQRPLTKEVYDNNGTLVYKETYSYDLTSEYAKKTTTVTGGENNPSVVTSEYTDVYGNKIKTEFGTDVETYTTDYAGNITSVKSARANNEGWSETHTTQYDYMGNVIKETDELGNITIAEYDSLGRMIKSYDQDGNATEYKYDNLNRLIEQKTPFEEKDGTIYYSLKKIWYDNNGNVIKESVRTNASGETDTYSEVKYTYDNRNRLVMTETNDGDKSNYIQNYYDANGNLLRVYTGLNSPLTINGLDNVTAGNDSDYAVAKYSYDNRNRLVSTTDALGTVETNTYDNLNGLMLTTTDRNGNTFSFAYDGLGNLTSKSLSDGTNAETTVYGLTGQALSKQNGNSTISYVYNDKGHLVSETDSASGTVKAYTYDSAGNRITFTLTRNGEIDISQSYTYDKLNRLTSVSENGTQIASYTYDNRNNRVRTVTDGETTEYEYNLAGMLTNQTTGDKLSESYTYYLNGNQKSKTSNGQTTNYTYDAMNRLVRENDTQYTFDDFGNRATMTEGNTTTTYTYDLNNRLTESNETTENALKNTKYFYDNNGNTVSKAVMTNTEYTGDNTGYNYLSEKTDENIALYEYNCYNQVIGIDTNGVKSTYTYLPDGLRQSKTVGEDTITFVYDNSNVVEEISDNGVNKYYRGFEIIKNNNDLYYLYNGHGDVAYLADSTGKTKASYIFDAYGNTESENDVYNPFGYRGEYQDSETGLIYLRARMYDPETGRFINEDPVKDGYNWYMYCSGNPIMFVDPSGLDAIVVTTGTMSVYGNAHTSVIAQDNGGNWYYFYWGNKNAVLLEVPSNKLSDLDTFNSWLIENGAGKNGEMTDKPLHDSSADYTTGTYIEGDFSKSISYYLNMAQKANITETIEGSKHMYKNESYKLTSINGYARNCMTVSYDGLKKGNLPDGTNFNDFFKWDGFGSIRPNDFRVMIRESFANQSFTKEDARKSATGTVGVNKPWYMSQNYYELGQKYGEMLK